MNDSILIKKNVLQIGRFEVRFRVYGNSDSNALPLVCVNGAQQSIATWRSVVSYFKNDCQIIAFDLPGQGGSKILSGGFHVPLTEQVDVMDAVLKHIIGNKKVNILSSSWGGAVASAYASHHSDRVNKLLLGAFGLSVNNTMKKAIEKTQELINTGRHALAGNVIIESFGKTLPESMHNQIKQQFKSMGDSNIQQYLSHITWSKNANLREEIDFSAITAETLILNGGADPIIDAKSTSILKKIMPNCMQIIVANTGHFMHFENSSLLELYGDFFNSILSTKIEHYTEQPLAHCA